MTLRIPNSGEGIALQAMLGKTAMTTLTLRLYSNNVTISDTTVAGSFTEVTGSGYAAQALTAANWTVTEGTPTSAQYPQATFTFTGAAGNVYGYYITNAAGTLLLAEAFTAGPFNIAATGDNIKITLNVTLQDTLD